MKSIRQYILIVPVLATALTSFSCAPVLSSGFMSAGDRTTSFAALRQDPARYKGKLFVFGGVIVGTKLTKEGSEIEALYVPVDRHGYFESSGQSEGRYLAVLPKEETMLDPAVYHKGRRVTVAAEFIEIQKGKIDETEYEYPVFRIKQLYLWSQERAYYPPPYYYDLWFYPYPYFYGGAWWGYPYYGRPLPAPGPPHGGPPPPPPR